MKRMLTVVASLCLATTAYADHHNSGTPGAAKGQGQGQMTAPGQAKVQAQGQMTAPAQAQGQGQMNAQGHNMDMSKMGPWSRKPTDEKKIKSELAAFMKQEEELMTKGDFNAVLARIDFPVFMATDNSKGVPSSKMYTREEYTAMMKPFYENTPKDHKMTHKPTWNIMSDSLVSYSDDFTMSYGKNKHTGKSAGLLVKKDGQWKWKMMSEAGWGDMTAAPSTGGSGPATTTTTTDGGVKK